MEKRTAHNTIRHPPLLWHETQKILRELEKKLNGPVLYFFTGKDASIDDDDVKYFYTHLRKIGRRDKLYFVLVSHGGSGESAWRIACLLRNFCRELIIVLPEVAASAATILTLAADKIVMTPLAYLTAVDTSIFHPLNPKDRNKKPIYVELDEVNRAIQLLTEKTPSHSNTHEIYKTIFQYIHPVALGAIARSTNLSEMLCSDIMNLQQHPPDAAWKQRIIKRLNTTYPSHTYPIPRHKAKELGLNVVYTDAVLDDLLGTLLTLSVRLTKSIPTYLDNSTIHIESISTIIESQNLRYYLHHILQKRLDVILKDWLTFKDEHHWMRAFRRAAK